MSSPLSYAVRHSQKAKRIFIRITQEGAVELVVPRGVSHQAAEAFLHARREWIMRTQARQQSRRIATRPIRLVSGEQLPFLGKTIELQVFILPERNRASFRERAGKLEVRAGKLSQVRKTVVRWYKARALDYLERQADAMADVLRLSIERFSVSDFRTQWGSCNQKTRRLAFSWRLMLAPEAAARYVVAHEVAHLRHANHSQRFWETVKRLEPEFPFARRWLRRHGHALFLE